MTLSFHSWTGAWFLRLFEQMSRLTFFSLVAAMIVESLSLLIAIMLHMTDFIPVFMTLLAISSLKTSLVRLACLNIPAPAR